MDEIRGIDVKVFASQGEDIPPLEFVAVLQRWIREHRMPGVLIDVADYSHMHHGAGVILVGHEANISIDYGDDRMGLLYKYKHPSEDSVEERLKSALGSALTACKLIEQEEEFAGRLKFDAGSLQVIANDRLSAPNEDASFEGFRVAVEAVVGTLFNGGAQIERAGDDSRARLAVEIRATETLDAAAVLEGTAAQA